MIHKRCLGFIVLFLATSAHAITPPPEGERWTRLQIDNIVLFSNARDRVTRSVAQNIARLRLVIARVSGLQVHSPSPVYVYVFREEADFAPYRKAATGSTKTETEIKGVFLPGQRASYAIMVAGDGLLDHVVAHEMTHGFLRNTVVGIPRWLDEGLAEFYGGLTPVGDSVVLGGMRQDYIGELSGHGLMPLRELFTFQPSDYASDDIRVGRFYAESWLFAHYLLIGQPARGAQLGDLLTRLDQGAAIEDAFEKAFHAKLAHVDHELGEYARRSRHSAIQYSKRELGEISIADPQPIKRADALIALADLIMVTDGWKESEPFLTKALELDANNAVALALMARLKDWSEKSDEAAAMYDRAININSDDVRPYAFAANGLVSHLQVAAGNGDPVASADIAKVRRILALGLKRAPDDPDMLATMGASYTFAGEDPKIGIQWSAKSFSIAPSRTDVASDLVLLYARAGKPALAKAMIDRVITPSGNPQQVHQAMQNLVLADYYAAEELLQAGKRAEAKPLLKKVLASTDNPKLRSAVEAKLNE